MDLHFLKLWDLYQPLLTETQREVTDLYFNCDLSLAEIAEQRGCSRQSVSDCLGKCRRQMEAYEEKLHFVQILSDTEEKRARLEEGIRRWAEGAGLSEEQRRALAQVISAASEPARQENTNTLL